MCFSDFADHTFATSAVASCIRRKLFSRHGIAGIGAADMKNPGTLASSGDFKIIAVT